MDFNPDLSALIWIYDRRVVPLARKTETLHSVFCVVSLLWGDPGAFSGAHALPARARTLFHQHRGGDAGEVMRQPPRGTTPPTSIAPRVDSCGPRARTCVLQLALTRP